MRNMTFLLLVGLAFAGCLGDDEPADDHADHMDDHDAMDGAMDDNSTANTTAPLNTAPVAMLAANTTNGTTIFTINVTDVDGDVVSWVLDIDGNGTIAEGSGNDTIEHAYDPGNYTATLSASDGLDDAEPVFLDLMIEAPEPGLPGQSVDFSFPLMGATVIGCLGEIVMPFHPSETDGLTHVAIPIEAHTWGYAYEATMTGTPASGDQGITFVDEGGAILGGGFLSSAGTGTVPESAAEAIMWSCYYVSNSGTYTSTA